MSQVDPHSIDILFAKIPEELSDEEVAEIADQLRNGRLKFMANPDANGEPKKSRGPADLKKKIDLPTGLSTEDILKDIGL